MNRVQVSQPTPKELRRYKAARAALIDQKSTTNGPVARAQPACGAPNAAPRTTAPMTATRAPAAPRNAAPRNAASRTAAPRTAAPSPRNAAPRRASAAPSSASMQARNAELEAALWQERAEKVSAELRLLELKKCDTQARCEQHRAELARNPGLGSLQQRAEELEAARQREEHQLGVVEQLEAALHQERAEKVSMELRLLTLQKLAGEAKREEHSLEIALEEVRDALRQKVEEAEAGRQREEELVQLIRELDQELQQTKQEAEASREREAQMVGVIAKMDEAMAKLECQLQASGDAAVATDELVHASATSTERRVVETRSASSVGSGTEEDCIFTDEELSERVDQLADATELYRKAARNEPLDDPHHQLLWDNMVDYNVRCAAVDEELDRRRHASSKSRKRVRFADEAGGELRSVRELPDVDRRAIFGEKPEKTNPATFHRQNLVFHEPSAFLSPAELAATPQQLRKLIASELLAAHSIVNWLLAEDIKRQKVSTTAEKDPWDLAVESLHKHYERSAFLYEQLEFLS